MYLIERYCTIGCIIVDDKRGHLIKDDEMIKVADEQYLAEKELTSKFGLSLQWFRRARYEGKCPRYFKLHGKFYYKEQDVVAWFKENMKPSHE
jgi:predicted DNA-binding transcriptional regulator AlpA